MKRHHGEELMHGYHQCWTCTGNVVMLMEVTWSWVMSIELKMESFTTTFIPGAPQVGKLSRTEGLNLILGGFCGV